jgi:hypothetical protein
MGDKIHKQPKFDKKVCDFVIKLSTNYNKVQSHCEKKCVLE